MTIAAWIAMTRKNARKQSQLAGMLLDLSFCVPTVVGIRLGKVAKGGTNPDRRTRAEIRRMGHEKVAATSESWIAMAFAGARFGNQLLSLTLGALCQPTRNTPPKTAARAAELAYNAVLDASNVGIEPYRKRARSNARRLTTK